MVGYVLGTTITICLGASPYTSNRFSPIPPKYIIIPKLLDSKY